MTSKVYLDNAATTQLRDEVIDAMANNLKNYYGNPSSTHSFGRSVKSIIEQSRKHIAKRLNVSASEIIFTSGGTEADNLILKSAVIDLDVKHIITSKIEHHAVLHTVEELQKKYDIEVSYVNIKHCSSVDLDHLEQLLSTSKKTLVSLMHINNEVGTITDIQRVADLCTVNNALFHSDTVQSIAHYHLDLQKINVDFLAASAHKFHGPKGIGFAFIRKNSGIKSMIVGGGQERGIRAGTESVHNIVGQDVALRIAYEKMEEETNYIKGLKQHFISSIKKEIPSVKFNGSCDDFSKSTYTSVNIRLPLDIKKASMLLFQLDLKGIACSKGSACQSGGGMSSHVMQQILTPEEQKNPCLRLSFSPFNTIEELDYVISVLKAFIEK